MTANYQVKRFPNLVEQMSNEDIRELENRLRKDYVKVDFEMGSSNGFLGCGESLVEVIERDKKTLLELGLTYKGIATTLGMGISLGKTRGFNQSCPWGDNYPSDNSMMVYKDPKTGLSMVYSFLMPHLIGTHHFFEGDTPYRIGPRDFARVIGKIK
ncbi:MAG: hypothetical protein HYW24_03655 [Candidatus Aenigmarchaeota archaeon]|nr:hypothetical protein [Candidatus Aenigmarchaeota archaeon]